MHLGQLNIQCANVQDLAEVIDVSTSQGTTVSGLDSESSRLIQGLIARNSQPSTYDSLIPTQRNSFVPLDLDVSEINEIDLVYQDDNRLGEHVQNEYAYDVRIQFVYAEDSELTYEQKVADFDRKNEAVTTLLK